MILIFELWTPSKAEDGINIKLQRMDAIFSLKFCGIYYIYIKNSCDYNYVKIIIIIII